MGDAAVVESCFFFSPAIEDLVDKERAVITETFDDCCAVRDSCTLFASPAYYGIPLHDNARQPTSGGRSDMK